MGIRGTPLQLFNNNLCERYQHNEIENCNSLEKLMKCGVPQGTIICPLLFNIYINSLLMLDTTEIILSYADDTVIVYDDQLFTQDKTEIWTRRFKNYLDITIDCHFNWYAHIENVQNSLSL